MQVSEGDVHAWVHIVSCTFCIYMGKFELVRLHWLDRLIPSGIMHNILVYLMLLLCLLATYHNLYEILYKSCCILRARVLAQLQSLLRGHSWIVLVQGNERSAVDACMKRCSMRLNMF